MLQTFYTGKKGGMSGFGGDIHNDCWSDEEDDEDEEQIDNEASYGREL